MNLVQSFENLIFAPKVNYYITIVQIPIVICLTVECYQAYKLKFAEFKFITIGWIVNSIYLIVNALTKKLYPENDISLIFRTFFDLLCMSFFFFGVLDVTEHGLLSKLKLIPKSWIIIFIIIAGVGECIPGSLHIVPFIHLRYVPAAFFDLTSLLLLSFYFKDFSKRFGQIEILYYITLVYAGMQILWIFQVDEPNKNAVLTKIDNIGFSLGLICKTGMLISLSILLVRIVNKMRGKETEKLARKLDFTAYIFKFYNNFHSNQPLEEQENSILESILSDCLSLFNIQLGYYASYEEKSGLISIKCTSQKYINKKGYTFSKDIGLTGKAIRTKSIQVKNDSKDGLDYFSFAKNLKAKNLYEVDKDVQSAVAIPVLLDNEPIGVYMFESEIKSYFTVSDCNILSAFVAQASTAIKNIHLLQEIEVSKNLLKSLMEIDREMIGNRKELKNTLELILKHSLSLAKGELGNIALVSRNKEDLVIVAQTNKKGKDNLRYKINESVSGQAVLEKRTIYYPNINEDNYAKRLYRNYLDENNDNLVCELVVPLIVNDEVIGIFNTESSTVDKFSKADRERVEGFATQVAIAIHIFQLFEDLKKHKDRLNALAEITLFILNSEQSLPDTLEAILNKGLQLAKKEHAEILLKDETKGDGVLVVTKSTWSANLGQEISIKENSICGIALRQNKIVYVRYLGKPDEIMPELNVEGVYFPTEEEKKSYRIPLWGSMKSELVLPLMLKDEVIGVLNIESDEFNDFKQDEIDILKNLALASAIAINNAQQFEKIKEKNRELIHSIDKDKVQMAAILGKVINHRIGNSVGTIRTILKDKFLANKYGSFDEPILKEFRTMLTAAEKVIGARREISEKMEALLNAKMAPIDFKQIKTAIEKNDDLYSNPEIKISINGFDRLRPVVANESLLLEGVFFELIRNAIKAMPEGGDVIIDGAIHEDNILISFKDEGCGIHEEHLDSIFDERFSVWRKTVDGEIKNEQGTGVGLYELKTVLEFFRGHIEVKSAVGKGTTFIVTLPITDIMSSHI